MAWNVETTDEFLAWWQELAEDQQEKVSATVKLLEERGPQLPHPYSSGINNSKHGQMRELRIQRCGRPIRVFYAFDERRCAVLLIGGDKTGDNRFYDWMVPWADKIFDDHIEALTKEHAHRSGKREPFAKHGDLESSGKKRERRGKHDR